MRLTLALLLLLACPLLPAQDRLVTAVPLVSGLERPTAIAHAGDGSGRLFIVEQPGRVRVFDDGALRAAPFLDLSDRVLCCGERGLLGIAFHPDFAANGEFFVNYTGNGGATVVSRFRVAAGGEVALDGAEEVILTVEQPFPNHNGGHLAFGPDGYLYIGLGDGGSAGDPENNAQDPMSLLGKMLRIDVDGGSPYAIPPSNPFAADDFTADEVWALGLRNPFRYSFDRVTGDLFIADVGQNAVEEVNLHLANTAAGVNYGWRRMEGSQCFNPASGCDDGALTLPAFEYGHSGGRCSITGGYRYRGNRNDALQGVYLFGDFCSGEIFGAVPDEAGDWAFSVLLDTDFQISSFGEDEGGELYVADIGGTVARLVAPLRIAPASGVYARNQSVDLSAVLRLPGAGVEAIDARLNGIDVSADFSACALEGTLVEGGHTLRCPGVPLSLLDPGHYEFGLSLTLTGGTTVSDTVTWDVLDSNEP